MRFQSQDLISKKVGEGIRTKYLSDHSSNLSYIVKRGFKWRGEEGGGGGLRRPHQVDKMIKSKPWVGIIKMGLIITCG